ncbi:MAG TPA: hypothetical protein VFX65_08325 [Candidatus Limnocylindrales bacterium]|jgi:hypothetical protein|nr:hypothetical protein [Candidatus Limnocylindrales bacterium]
MDRVGDLLQSIAEGFIRLAGGVVQAIVSAFQGVIANLQSILPGPWLPVAVILVVVGLGIALMRR